MLELVIVVGILGVIATVAVVIINPTQILTRSRDSNRLGELASINKALQVAEVQEVGSFGNLNTVYVSLPDSSPTCSNLSLPALPSDWFYACSSSTSYKNIDGTGWIPVNFKSISVGSPLPVLPVDPVNTVDGGLYYTYTRGSWILTATLESSDYQEEYATAYGTSTSVYVLSTKNSIFNPDVENVVLTRGSSSGGSVAVAACPGTDTSCGTSADSCMSCDSLDSCVGTTYRDYYCSSQACLYTDYPGDVRCLPGRYWVGDSGNWSDNAHWASYSGGAGGSSVPTAADDVYFNADSFTNPGQTVTIDVPANTKDMDWTGVTNNPTLAGTVTSTIYGSLTFVSGMTQNYSGNVIFAATSSGQTISLAGKTILGNTNFNGSGGGWTLQDDFNNGTATTTLTTGSLNTNSKALNTGVFYTLGTNTRSLTLGSSQITCSSSTNAWNISTITGLTFDAGTSLITLTGNSPTFTGGGKTYYDVSFPSAGLVYLNGSNTFHNLNRTGTAVTTGKIYLGGNQTITGILTIAGNSPANRVLAYSGTIGTARILTAAAVALSNVDFTDITAAGGASPFSGTSMGDALGNSNINFDDSVDQHWQNANGGTWSTVANWTSRVPLPQDNVYMDKAFNASKTVTADEPRLGKTIDWSGASGNPTFAMSSFGVSNYGGLNLTGVGTFNPNQGWTFAGRNATYNLTANYSANRHFQNLTSNIIGGTLSVQDALYCYFSSLTVNYGTFTTNSNVDAQGYAFSSGTTVNMGSGTWMFYPYGGTLWNANSGATINSGTSLISIPGGTIAATFAGGGKTYYNVAIASSSWPLQINSSNFFNNLSINGSPKSVNFSVGTTQTVNGTFAANGSIGTPMTFRSTTSGSKWTLNAGSVSTSYVDVKDSTGSGAAAPFTCGATCTDSGNNTGWSF